MAVMVSYRHRRIVTILTVMMAMAMWRISTSNQRVANVAAMAWHQRNMYQRQPSMATIAMRSNIASMCINNEIPGQLCVCEMWRRMTSAV